MKNKILSMLDITKKKVSAVVLCGVFITAIGTGTAIAANSMNSLQVNMENGITSYSTDGGNTWSKNAPDGRQGPSGSERHLFLTARKSLTIITILDNIHIT